MEKSIKVRQYEYVKKEVDSKDFLIPTETVYYFQTGIRRSIKITPLWTTWQKKRFDKEEEIWAFDIVCVYNSWIIQTEKFSIALTDLEDLYYSKNVTNDKTKSEFVKAWIDGHFSPRTKEYYRADLMNVINKILS